MSKTIRNVYDKKLTYDAIIKAYERASKRKRNKKELINFNINLETNLIEIYDNLKSGIYKVGNYRSFIIKEPKERVIKALPFRDRIVQQWYVEEFIKPYIIPRFIKDTYACIEKRGTHKAVYQTQKYMRIMEREYKNYYVLKFDIKKYFYSIDKDILYKIMTGYIKDKKLLCLTKVLIYDDGDNLGIPIGNYTSQFFANIYLNELDKFIKESLKLKYYVRYMDDFIILLKDKIECKKVFDEVSEFLASKLNLVLNRKSRYFKNKFGINFCGYIIYENHILLRKRSKTKIKNNIRVWKVLKTQNKLDRKKALLSWNSWLGHAKHANSYNFIKHLKN